VKKLIFIILMGLFLSSCARVRHLEYAPFVHDIDGKNELSISTYPAWFAKDTFSIPFVYKKRVTHDKLYFQVFIRDINKKSGKNHNVESIRIHSFSYRIGNNPSTELISDYDANFWMQSQPEYNPNVKDTVPILYVDGWTVSVDISFTLNGKDYKIQGEMPSAEYTTSHPLIMEIYR
jgi:hypothetical protein